MTISLVSLWEDFAYGARQISRSPGFAALAILTFAIGIGACTVMFSVVNTVLFRPIDYPEPDRMVIVSETNLKDGSLSMATPGAYFEWRRQATVFEG